MGLTLKCTLWKIIKKTDVIYEFQAPRNLKSARIYLPLALNVTDKQCIILLMSQSLKASCHESNMHV